MDKCSQIVKCFWSDQLESWEQGLAMLQEPPQGPELYEKIGKAVRCQAKLSGVPAIKLNNSPLVEKLEDLALDLLRIRPLSTNNPKSEPVDGIGDVEFDEAADPEFDGLSSDDDQRKLPGLVRFIRRFVPGKDDGDIWTHIVEKRIKPALVRRCTLESKRKTSNLDPEKELPQKTIARPSDLSVHDPYKEMLVKDCLANLTPKEQAIFLMTYWSFLTTDERNKHRLAIIATAIAHCSKKKSKENWSGTEEELAKSLGDAFQAAETAFQESELKKRVEATELQVRISYHFAAAEDAESCKAKKAQGFLSQQIGSQGSLNPPQTTKPQEELRRTCRLAVDCSSQDEFNARFYSIHPLDSMYHYKQRQGVLTIRDQGLWFLMWFGRFCQRQRYHLAAYQSLCQELDCMKSVLGFSDQQIGEVLCETPNNIRVLRHRYREKIMHLRPPESKNSSNTGESSESLTQTICVDYEG